MSKFTDFYKKLSTDDAVAADMKEVFTEKGIKSGTAFADLSDDVLNAIIPVAKKAGFDFTLEEVKAYFKKSSDDTLSDDELESVAGGTKQPYVELCVGGGYLFEL